jgi:hypothetical protein
MTPNTALSFLCRKKSKSNTSNPTAVKKISGKMAVKFIFIFASGISTCYFVQIAGALPGINLPDTHQHRR